MHQVLVAAHRIFTVAFENFSCGMWTLSCIMCDLVPWPGIEPGPPALGAWSLSHWTTREVLEPRFLFLLWGKQTSLSLSLSLLESCCVDVSFHFSQCLSRSGMTGSYGNSLVTFVETTKLCSCAAVPFHISQQPCVRVAISSLSPQHMLFSFFEWKPS